jgi:TDG/mug DNA glycosylase family protein
VQTRSSRYRGAMGFSREELEAARDRSVPDLLGAHVDLLLVGVNPGLWTAAAQAHFAKRGNRFYPALHRAGLSDRLIDASGGMSDTDADDLVGRGIGITNLVNRATARADELTAEELRSGAARLGGLVDELRPRVVVVLGITAYRTAFERPGAAAGWQNEPLFGARVMLAGNPSGLNAHQTVDDLADLLREAATVAGVAG